MNRGINIRRRAVTGALAAGILTKITRARSKTTGAKHRVLIIGAGFGGATCAKVLRLLSPATEVLLVDSRPGFLTGPQSNLVIAGLRSEHNIERRLSAIGRAIRVPVMQAPVTDLDPTTLTLTAGGHRYRADRIVVSPGIDMRWDLIEGIDAARSDSMPHAWLGDNQVRTLRERLRTVPDGGLIVVSAPPNPYRCPPGPYERASLMAYALATSGRARAKILVADAKDDFSKSALFKLHWDAQHGGMIEWVSRSAGGEVVRVDVASGAVWLRGAGKPLAADLASIIPAQRAADLARRADLVDESGWCPINADSYESLRHPGVHVIGDACASAPIPKSAFAANSQAKLCASAIAASFAGAPAPDARLLNTCYSLLSPSEAISVSGMYAAAGGKPTIVSEGMSPLSGDMRLRNREAVQAYAWYDSITFDSFGSA